MGTLPYLYLKFLVAEDTLKYIRFKIVTWFHCCMVQSI